MALLGLARYWLCAQCTSMLVLDQLEKRMGGFE